MVDKEGLAVHIEKKKLLDASEISLILDTYDDIFSDFDPRPYIYRAISDDLLQEIKRATRDRPSGLRELRFLIPAGKRNTEDENLIKKRLKDHFKKHYIEFNDQSKKIKRKGYSFALIGIGMIIVASYLETFNWDSFLSNLVTIVLEPGGWFLGWTGLDHLIYNLEEHKEDLGLYEKMSQCDFDFVSY